MTRYRKLITTASSLAAFIATCICTGQVQYGVTVLERRAPVSDNETVPYAINQHGETCGWAGYFDGEWIIDLAAVKWSVSGEITILSPSGNYANALGLNDKGWVVGHDANKRPYLWRNDESIALSQQQGFAYDINNFDEVVASIDSIGCFWTEDGGLHPLSVGEPAGASVTPLAINENGQIVGSRFDSRETIATLWASWEADPTLLGTLGGTTSVAHDVSDSGCVAGYSRISPDNFDESAFLWEGGVMTELQKKSGSTYARAEGINNRSQIVGYNLGPVMWYHDEFIDLTGLVPENVTLRYVYDINDRGQICGEAFIEGDEFLRGVLLTPRLTVFAPEPGVTGKVNTITIDGGTPDQRVVLIAGLHTGSTDIPGCPGLSVGIDSPHLLGTTIINSFGLADFTQYVPGYASGRTVYLAAVEPATCRVSETITHTFP